MNENNFVLEKYFTFESQYKNQTRTSGLQGHYHNLFEVYYLLEGTCWYFIDKKSYHLTAGDIAFIPEGVIHRTSYETPEHSRLLFFCDTSYIPDTVRDFAYSVSCFAKNDEYTDEINRLFSQIESESKLPDEFSEDAIRAKVAELLILIARASRESENKKEESPIVEKAVKYIRAHYAEDITLSDTADFCYVSKEHLSRTFKKETGFGFNEYVTAYRLKKAETLLRSNPKARISQVALLCGFNDSNYFSKVYKRVLGKSPTDDKKNK